MNRPFKVRLGFTREHQLHNSGPDADANTVRPHGRYGVGVVTEHPVGILVVAGMLIVLLIGVPESRAFFAGAFLLGAVFGLLLWLRHR